MNERDELSPVAKAVAVVLGLATAVLTTWLTVNAFLDSFGWGLVWLIIIDPIMVTVCWWASMLILIPVSLATRRR